MSVLEIVGVLTGALSLWLLVEQSVRTFPLAIVSCGIFFVVFVRAGIYADAGLQVVNIALSLLGWYWWLHGGPDHGALKARKTPAAAWPITVVGVIAGAAALYFLLRGYTDSTVPGLDAATTSLSVAAQVMQSRKWIGNWWLWIIADVGYIGLYASKGLWLTTGLYTLYLGMCIQGLRAWTQSAARATAPVPVVPPSRSPSTPPPSAPTPPHPLP